MKNADGIVRVGGVGTGRIFKWAHLNPYPRLAGKARLVGFYDVVPAAADSAMAAYRKVLEDFAADHPAQAEAVKANLAELKVHRSLESLLGQVDVIDVCTHSRGRMAAALAALEAGVHAMVEKPMARTWIEADRAVRAFAASPGVFLQLNDDNVFEPKYRTLRDALAAGSVGPVQSIMLIRGSPLSATSVLKSQANGLENGGGCLMDYGTHGLAGVWYALGTNYRPVKVEAVSIAVLHRHRVLEGDPFVMEVDDNARIKVFFEDPARGSWATVFLEASWCGGHIGPDSDKSGTQAGGYVHVVGDEGVIDATSKTEMTIRRWDGGVTVVPMTEHEAETVSFNSEIETFIDCVRAGRAPEFDAAFGAEIIAIVGAAYMSAIEKRAVTLEEFKKFCRGLVTEHGDNEEAEEALLARLLAPYRLER